MAYTKTTDFASKDSLLTGDPAKVVKGSEIDAEFENIEAAIGTTTGSGAVVLATAPTLTTPTLGNASGDSVTITAATIACTNGLNFDSNTFVIDATNNRIGIGTTDPNYLLQLHRAAAASSVLQLSNTASGSSSTDGLQIGLTNALLAEIWQYENADLRFGANNTEHMRIKADGDRVVTKATSQYASGSDGYAIVSGGSSASLGATVALFGESHATNANELHLRNAGNTTRVKLDANGNLLVGVTSATSSGGKIETSNGLTFPATQSACANANTLDDYEEGTWTATVTFGGANVGMTYATRTAHYVKVGSTCFFQLYLRLSAKGSSTGLAVVGGLPFTSDGSSAYSAVAVSIYDPIAGTAIASTTATVGSSSTNISLYSTTGGTLLYLTQGSFTDDTAVVVSGHYKVA